MEGRGVSNDLGFCKSWGGYRAVWVTCFSLVTGHKYSGGGVPGLAWELGFGSAGLSSAPGSAFFSQAPGDPHAVVWTSVSQAAQKTWNPSHLCNFNHQVAMF